MLESWNLRDLKDTRENLIESVNAAAAVPPAGKAMLTEAIKNFDPKAKLIRLDVHAQNVATRDKGDLYNFTFTLAQL